MKVVNPSAGADSVKLYISYRYWDRANRDSTVAVKIGNNTSTWRMLYHDTGPIKRIIYPATVNLFERYNLTPRNFVASVIDSLNGTPRFRHIYTYNSVGDRSSDSLLCTKPAGGTVQGKIRWNYDNIRRLTATRYPASIAGGDSAIYAYDAMGNRTSKVSGGGMANYTYNLNNNELTSNGGNYYYDNNGNLVRKTLPNLSEDNYSYDFENRLSQVKYTFMASESARFEYDGIGQRTRKVGLTDTTRYTWDGLYPVVEWNNQGKLKQTFVYANGLLLGVVDSTVTTNKRYYVLHDGLGSSIALTDSAANIKRSLIYSDFGQSLVDTTASSVPTLNRLYAGYSWDGSPANFYWMKGRHSYDPTLGRFGQEDIKQDWKTAPQLLNLYVYVTNSPATLTDQTGLRPLKPPCDCNDPAEQQKICNALKGVQGALTQLDMGEVPEGSPVAVTYCYRILMFNIPETRYAIDIKAPENYCTGLCLEAHENIHRIQCRRYGPSEYNNINNKVRFEKEAYKAQEDCLRKMLASGFICK